MTRIGRPGRIALVLSLALVLLAPASALAASAPRPAAATPATAPGSVVNINTASLEELDALPGIGPALAKRIVEYRREHGPFAKVDDLLAVKGIGPKMLAKIKDRLGVGPAK